MLTTGLEFRIKYGVNYGTLMKYEHVNTAQEVEELLRFFFKNVKLKVFGITRKLSIYQIFICSNPDKTKCKK